MNRRSFLVALCLILLLVGGLILTPFLMLCYEPDTYTRAAVPPGEERTRRSEECFQGFLELYDNATNGGRAEPWGVQFHRPASQQLSGRRIHQAGLGRPPVAPGRQRAALRL